MNNREITFVIKMRNEARAAIAQFQTDLSKITGAAKSGANQVLELATSVELLGKEAKNTNREMANLGKAGTSSGNGLKNVERGFNNTTRAAGHAKGASAGVTRELLVLAREAARGNWSRFGGSLSILAGQLNLLKYIFSPLGLAIIAVTGIFVLFAAQLNSAATEAAHLNNTIQVTGNYANISAGQFRQMGEEIAKANGHSVSSSIELARSLVGTGRVAGENVAMMARDIQKFADLTGTKAEDAQKEFLKFADGPSKAMLEFNKIYPAYDANQLAIVQRLEERGQKEQAQALAMKFTDEWLKQQTVHLGPLESALRTAGNAWDGFWRSALGTEERQKAQDNRGSIIDQQIADIRSGKAFNMSGKGARPITDAQKQALLAPLLAEQAQLKAAAASASATAQDSRNKKAGTDALGEANTQFSFLIKNATTAGDAVEKFKKLYADFQKGKGDPANTEVFKEYSKNPNKVLAEIRKHYDPADFKKGVNEENPAVAEIKSIMTSLGPYYAALSKEADLKEKLVKLDALRTKNGKAYAAALKDQGINQQQLDFAKEVINAGVDGSKIGGAVSFFSFGNDAESEKSKIKTDTDQLTALLKLRASSYDTYIKLVTAAGYADSDIQNAAALATAGVNTKLLSGSDLSSVFSKFGSDAVNEKSAGKDRKTSLSLGKLLKARAAGGKGYDALLHSNGLTDEQVLDAGKGAFAGRDNDQIKTAQEALKSFTGQYGNKGNNADDKGQAEYQQLMKAQTTDATSFQAALAKLGISQKEFNDDILRYNVAVGNDTRLTSQAKVAATNYFDTIRTSGVTMQGVLEKGFHGAEDALTQFVITGKLSFKSLIDSMIADLARYLVQQEALDIAKSFSGGGGGGGGGNFLSTAATVAASFFGFHSGGSVGSTTAYPRSVNPGVFEGAKRFHTGGMVGGLSHGEVPIIAKKGEAVMPTVRLSDGTFGVKAMVPDNSGNGQGLVHFNPVLNITVGDGGGMSPQDHGQMIAKQMIPAMRQMIDEQIVRNLRPGGILNGGTR